MVGEGTCMVGGGTWMVGGGRWIDVHVLGLCMHRVYVCTDGGTSSKCYCNLRYLDHNGILVVPESEL